MTRLFHLRWHLGPLVLTPPAAFLWWWHYGGNVHMATLANHSGHRPITGRANETSAA